MLIDGAYASAHEKDIQLVFAGDGPLKEDIASYAKKLTHPPVMKFFSRDEMLKVYTEPQTGDYAYHRGDTWKVIGIIGDEWYHVWFPATGEYGFVRQDDLSCNDETWSHSRGKDK